MRKRWCAPCKKLTPILEDLATEAQGKWILAKFDIDKIPQLANALKVLCYLTKAKIK